MERGKNLEHFDRLYHELLAEWGKGDIAQEAKLKSLLTQLKIQLSEAGLLFPSTDRDESPDTQTLTMAREVLEIGAFQAIRSQDVSSFERYMNLLSSFYNDLGTQLVDSANRANLVALSLLKLLSQNRIAEFHTLLEALSQAVTNSEAVTWVITLEQYLMEGSYSRVWRLCRPNNSIPSTNTALAESKLPRPEFAFFVTILIETVRNEIAACDERAYTTLPLADAKTLLFYDHEAELRHFAGQRKWYIDSRNIVHFPSSPHHPSNLTNSGSKGIPNALNCGLGGFEGDKELNKERVVVATLNYAKELEQIV